MGNFINIEQINDGFFGVNHEAVLEVFQLPIFSQAPDLGKELPQWIIPKSKPKIFDSHFMRDYICEDYYEINEIEIKEGDFLFRDIIDNESGYNYGKLRELLGELEDRIYEINAVFWLLDDNDAVDLIHNSLIPDDLLKAEDEHGEYFFASWVGGHLAECARSRAARGIVDCFFERILTTYKLGGYPFGWTGHWEQGSGDVKLFTYFPPLEIEGYTPPKGTSFEFPADTYEFKKSF